MHCAANAAAVSATSTCSPGQSSGRCAATTRAVATTARPWKYASSALIELPPPDRSGTTAADARA
jgi:hypothetical protein